ncbi:MAG: glycerol-3-phosphate 1-O-acyltransferase PlsY [Bacillota bacterium]
MRFLAVLISYLLGAIPVGYITCKYWKGLDILRHGSGNIGFTNVLRTAGKGPAAVVLVGDIGKGALAAYLGKYISGENWGIICGVAAMLGHSYSVFLKFKGGKLISTGAGVLFVLAPEIGGIAAATWLLMLAVTRYVSMASITAGIIVPVSMVILRKSAPMIVFGLAAAVFVIYRHRDNIRRLLAGQEYKIGQKAAPK